MVDELNPYAAPKHDDPAATSRAASGVLETAWHFESIRREHITTEANIKGLGFLLYLGTAGLASSGAGALATDPHSGAVNLILAAALGSSAYWLRRLDPRGRLMVSISVGLGVVGSLYTLLSEVSPDVLSGIAGRLTGALVLLTSIWTAKASTVMTPHYRDVVIPATPHVKHKTSLLLLVLLGILVLTIVLVVATNR